MTSFELIDARAAASNEEARVFIDTRDPAAYATGHIPGAVNIREIFTYECGSTPEDLLTLQQHFANLFSAAGLSGRELVIVYEESTDSGNGQSCRGCFLLRYLRYPKVALLDGGLRAWTRAGYALTTTVPAIHAQRFPLMPPDHDVIASKQDLLRALNDPAHVIIDVRDAPEWSGQQSAPMGHNPAIRCGYIPGAVWLEWRALVDTTQAVPKIKSAAEVLAICRARNITPSQKIIVYCYKGSRAASTLIALQRAGFTQVKNYFASWNEWGRDPALPIESGPATAIETA